ncbi:hypothetical protein V497_08262 [Pseudogymnoascus sp. VKM F-4516 (FW-969)]|nr:hypothetical protein V497_08262 [Pseudogymnoascus sp. VKM F-4516 (FW-969)]
MSTSQTPGKADYDVIIIGAGISGINAAYRVQTELPNAKYTILEARHTMGGTWDLFQFPGVRSDSDLHTFGFQWRPWQAKKAYADGKMILDYVKDAAETYGIDKKIQYHHHLEAADWSSADQLWNLQITANGEPKTLTAHFCIMSTGYYNYTKPLDVDIPGIENFKGTIVHPQFWPQDLDYTDKNMVVIGSGATAVTLLPVVAETAKHVTMLQRSPTYILVRSSNTIQERIFHAVLPRWLALKLVRWTWIILPWIFFRFCKAFPAAAKSLMLALTKMHLPKGTKMEPDWVPSYNPWEQRLCTSPDADFFLGLKTGKSDVVTGTIDNVSADTITLHDGRTLHPDIIVTATGLRLCFAGAVALSVDGVKIDSPTKYVWKGMMMQDLPNMAFPVGYLHSSWTLGADATAKMVCRLIKHMQSKQISAAIPRLSLGGKEDMGDKAYHMSSTYMQRGMSTVPRGGDRGPWWTRNYLWQELVAAKWGNLTNGLEFVGGSRWGVGKDN